jgi:hypothetical protein
MWRTRFSASGIAGLMDTPWPGAKPVYREEAGKCILAVLIREFYRISQN